MTRLPKRQVGNHLLSRIMAEDGGALAASAHMERPRVGQVLSSLSEPAADMWFPISGVVALSITDRDGRTVQSGLVGPEGCVGLEGLFPTAVAMADATVQVAGDVQVVPTAQVRLAMEARPAMHASVSWFLHELSAQSLQTVACNRLHSLDARCCRWLLMLQDRTGEDVLPLTQESLATMLGSGRPRINMLLATLDAAGLVRRHRGRIQLLSRPGLLHRACDCYRRPRPVPKVGE